MKKMKVIVCLTAMFFMLNACVGDRKPVDLQEMNDTSFVNKKFKGNLIDYSAGMSACDKLTAAEIAQLYGVSADAVIIDDPITNPHRQATGTPLCSFYIKSGEEDFKWLRGSISVEREIGENEVMGDVAKATGAGTDWEEAWALNKSIYKSAEWVPNTGKAAIWNSKQRKLEIKLDGYTLLVHPLGNKLNEEEEAANRDYKKMALGMAKAAGYIN